MIFSMTGYAARTRDVERGALHLELKSVNSRYLDFQFRICEELRSAEPALRELISARISRGKIECRLNFVPATTKTVPQALSGELLARLADFDAQVRAALPQATPLSVGEVLRWPGMFGDDTLDTDALVPEALALMREALEDFAASREREGAKLAAVILERVARIRELVRAVAPHIPAAQAAFQDKLRQRLQDAIGSVDDERIRQELVLFAARIDVDEELARLSTHLDEVERVLKAGGASGKRLDFLMQELNREANTLGSKSVVSAVSQTAMDLKLLIEQMREQIQNLE
ncbi:YicC/YloC family endoribonuclease [Rhodocyclus tenuis]|nr:YicC/YloC family endoribonuclease [Rhodocyclus tenuis]MBK1681705.1 YicC family protein [Rhodocyclus tenuis]